MPGARSTGRSPQDLPGGPESPATSCPTGIPNRSQNRWHRPLPPGSLQSTCRPDTASLPSRRADRRHARADVIALAAAPRTTHPERLCSQAPVSRQSTERRLAGARFLTGLQVRLGRAEALPGVPQIVAAADDGAVARAESRRFRRYYRERAATASRPWPSVKQPSVRTDRSRAQNPSAMRPWTPRHNGLQRHEVTHAGTEENGPSATRIRSQRAVSAGSGRCWVRTNVG